MLYFARSNFNTRQTVVWKRLAQEDVKMALIQNSRAKTVLIISTARMVIAILFFAVGIAQTTVVWHWTSWVNFGLWGGFTIFLAGFVGYLSVCGNAWTCNRRNRSSNCYIGTFLAFTIFSTIIDGFGFIIYGIAVPRLTACVRCYREHGTKQLYCEPSYNMEERDCSMAAELGYFSLALLVVEFILSILSAALCCSACCCIREPNTSQFDTVPGGDALETRREGHWLTRTDSHTRVKIISFLRMAVAALLFSIAIAQQVIEKWSINDAAFGLWGGVWIFVTGVLGYLSVRGNAWTGIRNTLSTCYVGTVLGFSIVSSLIALAGVICYGVALLGIQRRLSLWEDKREYGRGLGSFTMALFVAEFILSVVSIMFCCITLFQIPQSYTSQVIYVAQQVQATTALQAGHQAPPPVYSGPMASGVAPPESAELQPEKNLRVSVETKWI